MTDKLVLKELITKVKKLIKERVGYSQSATSLEKGVATDAITQI